MAKFSPMMEQYLEIKRQNKDCLVLFRLGDFYELFFDDALVASKVLDIALTGRDCGQAERAPMCGVPYHSANAYIAKLVENGYKVAVCEQVEDAKQAKTIVKREVVRIITPGTVTDMKTLDEGKNSYICCIYQEKQGVGIAFCDVTTGEFFTTSIEGDTGNKVYDELARISPKEIIINQGFDDVLNIENIFSVKPYVYYSWCFDYDSANKTLCDHFNVITLSGYGLLDKDLSVCASGALMEYLRETQKNRLFHISTIKYYSEKSYMSLDISSRKNLELTETLRERSKKGTLLWVLDKTKTAMGGRLLRKWVEQPLITISDINRRLDAVSEIKDEMYLRNDLRELLKEIGDIERLMGKVVYGTANGKDLISLKGTAEKLPEIKKLLFECKASLNIEMNKALETLDDIKEFIDAAIDDDAPINIKDGGVIREGFNSELDRYRTAKKKGTTWILEKEAEERQLTGIKSLKIKYNKVFGYYIEVTNTYKNLIPERYIRRQTIANGERYTTVELKEIEEAILEADDNIAELELKLFTDVRKKVADELPRIQLVAQILATLDVIQSFAEVSDSNGYCKPTVNDDGVIAIKNGRHPVVEQTIKSGFVPNDVYLNSDSDRLSIITGPNMAGKSTYMRQVALIVVMAQMGCFIPADSGVIGVVDQIFTRVGASDDLATGQSTFMVEMTEVANIINNATKNSLLILDEIGRGTSTFDGLSIAWSVLEFIAEKIGAKTLFSTHYHELTELEGKLDGVKNYCMMVREQGENIIFIRKIVRGGADNSYGVHVAKLAGIPNQILNRANELLQVLNNADIMKAGTGVNEDSTIRYGKQKPKKEDEDYIFLKEIMEIDVDSLTPRDALRKLYELQGRTKLITLEQEGL